LNTFPTGVLPDQGPPLAAVAHKFPYASYPYAREYPPESLTLASRFKLSYPYVWFNQLNEA
jgi:hypothetical protein